MPMNDTSQFTKGCEQQQQQNDNNNNNNQDSAILNVCQAITLGL